ncbi:hypothetical protein CKA32_002477 [Geitlerinema sp. FC II]|nr:hypothetical protein CKA32_002477 [Geitlerinema sp. FC II]
MNLTVLLIEPNGALERDLECPIAIEHCNVISTSDRWLGVYQDSSQCSNHSQ